MIQKVKQLIDKQKKLEREKISLEERIKILNENLSKSKNEIKTKFSVGSMKEAKEKLETLRKQLEEFITKAGV